MYMKKPHQTMKKSSVNQTLNPTINSIFQKPVKHYHLPNKMFQLFQIIHTMNKKKILILKRE
eukprot:jgi/Orpsp1_1/1192226/evm.model.d7180000091515.1